MSANITDKYLNRKVKNISQYMDIILKKIYKKDIENTKVFEVCIRKYIDEFILKENDIGETLKQNKEFFNKNRIGSEEQKKFIVTLIDIVTQMEPPIKDIKFIDNVCLFSEVMAIAFEIENKTSKFTELDIGYKEVIDLIKEKYKPFSNEKLEMNIKLSNKALKKCVNENIKTNREFIKKQNENPFYLEFYKFNSEKKPPNNILGVRLKDSSIELSKFNHNKIESLISQKKIVYHHTLITMEMVTFKALEVLFERNRYEMFLIRLPDDFLAKKSNKNKMLSLTQNIEARKKIGFEIDHRQLEKFYDAILEIKNSNYKIAVVNLKKKEELTDNLKQIADCIVVDSKLCKDIDEIKQCCKDNKTVLLERDVGKEEVILEL